MADRTEKIDNEHADEQIEVSGSSIDSDEDPQDDQFGNLFIYLQELKTNWVKATSIEVITIKANKLMLTEAINQLIMRVYLLVWKLRNSSNQYKGKNSKMIKVYTRYAIN